MSVPGEILRSSIVERLFAHADDHRPVFTHQDFPANTEHTLTWAELVERVRVVSARLRERAEPGERVAILAPQELSYPVAFFGVLAAGMIAVPLFDPAGSAHRGRLASALADCGAQVWLTSASAAGRVREFGQPRELLVVDELSGPGVDPVVLDTESPAYLQYTSGSTREPAGAVIPYRAIAATLWQAVRAYQLPPDTTCVGWIPFFHDMGLVQMVCLPVFMGYRSVFMAPAEFVRRPQRWLRQMSDYPEVFTAAPNFAYDLAVEAAPQAAGLDLSRVRIALNGAEPVRPRTVEEFQKAFAPFGFRREMHRPSYGLAEATVYVASAGTEGPTITAFDRDELAHGRAVEAGEDAANRQELVSVGRPVGQQVRIVRDGRVVPDGEMGEIWIHGENVAAGYWQRDDDSFFAGSLDGFDGWLRTGDLGMYHRGDLYITGRLKDLIVIDGRNHYPQDIEATAGHAHPAIRADRVAAYGVSDDRGEGVVVIAEWVRDADADELEVTRAARRAVSREHGVAVRAMRLVSPGELPRTSSGKISRSAARARYGDGHE